MWQWRYREDWQHLRNAGLMRSSTEPLRVFKCGAAEEHLLHGDGGCRRQLGSRPAAAALACGLLATGPRRLVPVIRRAALGLRLRHVVRLPAQHCSTAFVAAARSV